MEHPNKINRRGGDVGAGAELTGEAKGGAYLHDSGAASSSSRWDGGEARAPLEWKRTV